MIYAQAIPDPERSRNIKGQSLRRENNRDCWEIDIMNINETTSGFTQILQLVVLVSQYNSMEID